MLEQGSETKLCDLASHVRNMESLVQRIHVKEKLRIVFIGPTQSWKEHSHQYAALNDVG